MINTDYLRLMLLKKLEVKWGNLQNLALGN